MDWISYWNGAPSVYVSARHKETHYRLIADGIAALVDRPDARVLDFGCGEALAAARVAQVCERLYLADGADNVRAGLAERFAAEPAITVLAAGELHLIEPATLDLIVVNSVAQYLAPGQLETLIADWMPLLAPTGHIVFADIIPTQIGAAADAGELLRFAATNGFLASAVIGLARTALSDYRKLRADLGLAKYSEDEFIALLAGTGLHAKRIHPNLGHNQQRMAFAAHRMAT